MSPIQILFESISPYLSISLLISSFSFIIQLSVLSSCPLGFSHQLQPLALGFQPSAFSFELIIPRYSHTYYIFLNIGSHPQIFHFTKSPLSKMQITLIQQLIYQLTSLFRFGLLTNRNITQSDLWDPSILRNICQIEKHLEQSPAYFDFNAGEFYNANHPQLFLISNS